MDQPWLIIDQTKLCIKQASQDQLLPFFFCSIWTYFIFNTGNPMPRRKTNTFFFFNLFSFQATRIYWSNLWFLRWWRHIWHWRSWSVSLRLAEIWVSDSIRKTNGLQRSDTTLLPIEMSKVFDCFIKRDVPFWWNLLL